MHTPEFIRSLVFLTVKLVLESARWGVDKGTGGEKGRVRGDGIYRGTERRMRSEGK